MRIACWIPKATNTHSQYLLLFTATMVTRTHLIVTSYVHRLSCATFIPPKVTPVSALREVHGPGRPYTRTLNGQSTVSASRQHIAAVLCLLPSDLCRNQHPCQPARPVTSIIIIIIPRETVQDSEFRSVPSATSACFLCHARTVPPAVCVHQL